MSNFAPAAVIVALLLATTTVSAQEKAPEQAPAPRASQLQINQIKKSPRLQSMRTPIKPAMLAPQDERPVEFRWANEELYYSVRINGVEAVRAGVRAGDVRYKDGHPYVPVSGTAQSTGIFHTIYPVNDRAHTYVHPQTLRPVRSEKFLDEAGNVRSYHVDYVHTTYQAKVRRERKDQRSRNFVKPIPGTTNDMMTWFYELRDKRALEVGESMSYFIYDGWRLYKLEATVVKKEDVYTPMGWFKTYKIDFSRTSLNTQRKKGESPVITVHQPSKPTGSLWMSRDENMIPVKIAVGTDWGVGEAILIKYKLPSQSK